MKKGEINEKFNWPLIGNGHVVDFLSKSILNDKIAGAYIFLGPEDIGKTTAAHYFAKSLLCEKREGESPILPCGECLSCNRLKYEKKKDAKGGEDSTLIVNMHADLHLIKREKDKKNITVEQIRDLITTLGMSSFMNSYKVGIIKNAQHLSLEASNSLLKTLEEPKNKTVIILVASSLEALPETIVSRSQIVNFHPVKTDLIYDHLINIEKASRSQAKKLAKLALGRPALAIKYLKDEVFFKDHEDTAQIFLKLINLDYNQRLEELNGVAGEKAIGLEASYAVERAVKIWLGLVRDMLLISQGQNNLTQNELINDREDIRFTSEKCLKTISLLGKSREYLKANVNPRFVLENIAFNI